VAWEGDRTTNWRVIEYPEYKANKRAKGVGMGAFDSARPGFDNDVLGPDETLEEFMNDMNRQEGVLKELLGVIGVRQYSAIGCEADDVMATLAARYSERFSVGIYTGDSDLRQMVNGQIQVVSPSRGGDVLYATPADVEAKHGVPPSLIPDLKALSGDSSDNIPGVNGIGPKKALALLKQYDSLERVVNVAEVSVEPPPGWPVNASLFPAIKEAKARLPLYKRLATVDPHCVCAAHPIQRDQRRVVKALSEMKMRSLIAPAELMALMDLGR
jgi:5'-3' exonuclease